MEGIFISSIELKLKKKRKMSLIDWTPGLSVGINSIDDQHKRIVRLINELNDNYTKNGTIIEIIINELIDYTETHFALEEKYFIQYQYPKTVSHIAEHKKLIKTVTDFKSQFDKGEIILSADMLLFLSSWLRDHIIASDKEYVSFFIEKGIK